MDKGESSIIKGAFNSILRKWQNKVIKGLSKSEDRDILAILESKK
jgi:hypothetical protein